MSLLFQLVFVLLGILLEYLCELQQVPPLHMVQVKDTLEECWCWYKMHKLKTLCHLVLITKCLVHSNREDYTFVGCGLTLATQNNNLSLSHGNQIMERKKRKKNKSCSFSCDIQKCAALCSIPIKLKLLLF